MLAICLLTWSMPAIERQLGRWQLLPQPQHLTELAVDDAGALPKTYTAGKPLPIAFIIINRTGNFKNYTYRVTETGNGQTVPLAGGALDIGARATGTLSGQTTPVDLGKRVKVTITLPYEHLSLHYWLERE